MQSTITTDQIQELTILCNELGPKLDSMTDEEHALLEPIIEASYPLLLAFDKVIEEMEADGYEDDDLLEDDYS